MGVLLFRRRSTFYCHETVSAGILWAWITITCWKPPASWSSAWSFTPTRSGGFTQRGGSRRGGGPSLPASRSASWPSRSEEHTSELQSRSDLVCRLLLEKKKTFYQTC